MKDNAQLLAEVAQALAPLPYRKVFLGGATTHLLISDVAAPGVTPTNDVDVVVDVGSAVEFSVHLSEHLRRLGLREDTSEGAPLCRWKVHSTTVDIMSPNEQVLGFSNRWYPLALERAETRMAGDIKIEVVDAVTFLGTKIEAFANRGRGDFLASKDIEDIIAVLDGRPELLSELDGREPALLASIAASLASWKAQSDFDYAIEGYLQADEERIPALKARIDAIISVCQRAAKKLK